MHGVTYLLICLLGHLPPSISCPLVPVWTEYCEPANKLLPCYYAGLVRWFLVSSVFLDSLPYFLWSTSYRILLKSDIKCFKFCTSENVFTFIYEGSLTSHIIVAWERNCLLKCKSFISWAHQCVWLPIDIVRYLVPEFQRASRKCSLSKGHLKKIYCYLFASWVWRALSSDPRNLSLEM